MKNRFFQLKKWEIQVIIFIIMLTRSSKRIFNPMHYTGFIHAWETNFCFLLPSVFAEKYFLNLVDQIQIWIVITLLRMICHYPEFRLVPNLSQDCI